MVGRRSHTVFVAPDAGNVFAGHAGQPTAHQLKRLTLGIERLDRDRRVGRNAEQGRSVGLDRHRAQHAFDFPGPVGADPMVDAGDPAIAELVGEQSQRLDRIARQSLEARALVDVQQVHDRILPLRLHAFTNYGRRRGGPKRQRLEQGEAFLLLDQHPVVEHVDQMDSPQGIGVRLAGDEKILVAERVGMGELGPTVLGEFVLDQRFDFLAVPGNPLDDAVGFALPFDRIEDDQLTHAAHVMPGDDAGHLRPMVRDRPCVENRVRPVGTRAVVFTLIGPVGIHRKQDAVPDVRRVGVFPA